MIRPAVIVDLDGTLCDTRHRQHFVQKKPKDFKSFYGGIADDRPNEWCHALVHSLQRRHQIVLVSGRPEEYRSVSEAWLNQYFGSLAREWPLFMRKSGDYRQDYIVKEEIYREHIEPRFKVLFCVDDRKQVVDMWRRIGLDCLHCAEGDF